jgi:hypothetical protein
VSVPGIGGSRQKQVFRPAKSQGNRMNASCWRVRFCWGVSRRAAADLRATADLSATVGLRATVGLCATLDLSADLDFCATVDLTDTLDFVPEGRADNSPGQAQRSPGKGQSQHKAAPEGRREPMAQFTQVHASALDKKRLPRRRGILKVKIEARGSRMRP